MLNPLELTAAEVDAIRDLQDGLYPVDPDDPMWDGLVELGLVDANALPYGWPQLTLRGLGYKTE